MSSNKANAYTYVDDLFIVSSANCFKFRLQRYEKKMNEPNIKQEKRH